MAPRLVAFAFASVALPLVLAAPEPLPNRSEVSESVASMTELAETNGTDAAEVTENMTNMSELSATNATDVAMADLEAVAAASQVESSASLRGSWWWGHGRQGETCCMCSQHVGFTTLLYAAEDYSHRHGSHSARWWCNQQCGRQCRRKGGRKFGCFDERHLLEMDRNYGHRRNYHILHEKRYGNIC